MVTWTVSRRIVTGFSFVLGVAVVLATVGIVALRNAVQAYGTAMDERQTVLETALDAEASAQTANLQYLRFLLDARPAFLRAADSATQATRVLLERVRTATPVAERRALWSEALDRLDEWEALVDTSMRAVQAGRQDAATAVWTDRAYSARIATRDAIRRGVNLAREHSDEAARAAERAADRMQWLLFVTAVLAIGVGVLSGWLLNRAVTAPLRETTGILASSAAEILAATTQQAAGASETSAAVVQTSTTVDEVAQTADHSTERARAVADSARRAAEIGKAGREAVEQSVAAMAGVKEQVESIAGSIMSLAEQAQAIGEIIATVNEIAEQTNLLALNAAVEAARAGEQGRGFAVVAGEVRSLAEQSKRATVQVRQILGDIQRATSAAVMTTERGTHQVVAGTKQVNEAGETIRTLADAIAESAQAAAQIVASAGQQAIGMTQIRQAMRNIHEATQQTLASTRQAEQAAKDLNRIGAHLLGLVGRNGRELESGAAQG